MQDRPHRLPRKPGHHSVRPRRSVSSASRRQIDADPMMADRLCAAVMVWAGGYFESSMAAGECVQQYEAARRALFAACVFRGPGAGGPAAANSQNGAKPSMATACPCHQGTGAGVAGPFPRSPARSGSTVRRRGWSPSCSRFDRATIHGVTTVEIWSLGNSANG